MTTFVKSVKQVFAQVFGRADIEDVLTEKWEFSDCFPEDQKAAMNRPLQKVDGVPREPTHRKKRGLFAKKPAGETRPMLLTADPPPEQIPGRPARPRRKPGRRKPTPHDPGNLDPGRRNNAVDLAALAPSPESTEDDGVEPVRLTVGRPHPTTAADTEGGEGLGFGGDHAPYPADLDFEEDDAPPRFDTLDITSASGELQAPLPPIRLDRPAPPPELVVRPEADDLSEPGLQSGSELRDEEDLPADEEEIPLPDAAPTTAELAVLEAEGDLPGSSISSDEFFNSLVSNASLSISRRPKARRTVEHGPPPETIWQERIIRDGVIKDLKADADAATREAHQLLLSHLARVVDNDPLTLPPFPAAAKRLLGQNGRPATDEEVMEIVQSEPTLAGNVVKVANSPFYMAAVPVSSLNAAMMRIGLDQVRRVSLAAVVGSSYDVPGFRSAMAQVRLHSYATAIVAELLAPIARLDTGESFLAGLLHDAGEALTFRMVRTAVDRARDAGQDLDADPILARRLARKYHQRMGALFLGGWDLPASVASAMAYHHHPEGAEPRFTELVCLIHVADALADRAVEHSHTRPWREAMYLRNPGASREELARATATDGIDGLDVDDLLFQAPRRCDAERLRGVARSMLLRLDSSELASLDGGDALSLPAD